MKTGLAVIVLAACAPSPIAPPTATPAVPASTPPAKPALPSSTIAAIDVFGARHVADGELIATAGLAIGSEVVFSSPAFHELLVAAKQRLIARYHFALVGVSPISYFAGPDAGKVFITIDVVESDDTARMKFAPAQSQDVSDPEGLVAAWIDYEKVADGLLQGGTYRPPFTCKGGWHCAMGFNHPALEGREQKLIDQVPRHFAELIAVLRNDRDKERRAAAAFLIAYGKDRQQVVDAIVPSITDPEGAVRNNVLRVLVMIQRDADTAVIPLAPVMAALRFPYTTDRNKAGYALAVLAKHLSAADRARVARELGDVLIAMAAMKQPNNRDPAIDILKAISGEDHGTDAAAWRAWLDRQPRGQ